MLSLDTLAHWEAAVLASIRGARGSIEERDAQITRSGMYAEYPAIFNAYLEPASDEGKPGAGLEVAKRRLFLVWASFTQLPVDSGIAELPESSVRTVIEHIESDIHAERVDDELRLMLAWYRGTFPFMFDYVGGVRGLDEYLGDLSADDALLEMRRLRAPADFAGRGQLGEYWGRLISQ
jgi:hypothetical protein